MSYRLEFKSLNQVWVTRSRQEHELTDSCLCKMKQEQKKFRIIRQLKCGISQRKGEKLGRAIRAEDLLRVFGLLATDRQSLSADNVNHFRVLLPPAC
jgi:hypothetical protein